MPIVWIGNSIVSMFRFLETDIREQQKDEQRIQTSVDNIVKKIKSENRVKSSTKSSQKIVWKTKITFLLSETYLFFFKQYFFLRNIFFKIRKNFIASTFYLLRLSIFFVVTDTKKQRYASTKASTIANCYGKFQRLSIVVPLIFVIYLVIGAQSSMATCVVWCPIIVISPTTKI